MFKGAWSLCFAYRYVHSIPLHAVCLHSAFCAHNSAVERIACTELQLHRTRCIPLWLPDTGTRFKFLGQAANGLLVSKEKEGSLRVILPLIKQRECSETNWSDIDFCIWMKGKTSEWEIIVKCQRFHSIWPFGIVVVVVIFRPRLTLIGRPLLPQLFNARRPTRIERKFVIRKLKKL